VVVKVQLNQSEARRLAIASQAFGPRPAKPGLTDLRKLAARIHAFQIDSVNVLVRAHYVPAFARLGPYPMDALDQLTYQKRELFEFWGHAACLLPISLYPLVRYRMQSEMAREYMRTEQGAYMASVYAEVAERGPISVSRLSNPGKASGSWWGWSTGKATLEYLYTAGLVAIAGRRGFERLYDLTERVIPRAALEAPAPPQEDSMKELICLGAKAYGIGTAGDIVNYFNTDGWRDRMAIGPWWGEPRPRAGKAVARRLVSELVEEGRLVPADVEGWQEPAFMVPGARVPRSVHARALVTAFDSLVWERRRIERLFGMKYTISMYTPVDKRVHGYYVCPFLLGDTLVARCDLKADRQRKVLMVQSAFLETQHTANGVATELAAELRDMQAWLELERIDVAERGDLAATLRTALT
jgi:uncharacterized protein YcaQ